MITIEGRFIRRGVGAGLALALLATAAPALAQKMHKCSDGKGGTVFQQAPCGETAQEAEARAKERERIEAEKARAREEEARRKAESIQKARERDQAYQQQMKEREEERRKASTAVQGPAAAAPARDGSLPAEMETMYPSPWREGPHAGIMDVFAKKSVSGCPKYRFRQRANKGADYLVNCNAGGPSNVYYFVWPQTDGVRGPVRF